MAEKKEKEEKEDPVLKVTFSPPEERDGKKWSTVTASFTNANGPVEGQGIKFFIKGNLVASGDIDENGLFSSEIELRPGKNQIVVKTERGLIARTITIDVPVEKKESKPAPEPVALVSPSRGEEHTITYLVRDAAGKPVEGVPVVVTDHGANTRTTRTTKKNGKFNFKVVMDPTETVRTIHFMTIPDGRETTVRVRR